MMKFNLKNQSGVAAVEFAVILPLLVVIVLGIIEFSILFYDKAMVTNASREGARVGIVYTLAGSGNWTLTDLQGKVTTTVNQYLSSYLINLGNPGTTATAAVTTAADPGTGANTVTVTVTYPYTFMVIPRFIASITSPITLTAQTVMSE